MKSCLAKYRLELMGIGAIGVLMVHSLDIVPWPSVIEYIVNYGGLGVYMFMFLSGVGLYYSLSGRGASYSKVQFYKRRFLRVMLPYLLIAGVWYGVKYLLLERNLILFFYEWSTLSFWVDHKGAWYVAALIPIYLIYPFCYDWMEKGRRAHKTVLLLGGIAFVMVALYLGIPSLYSHLAQVLNSLWVFVLGNYYAKKVQGGKDPLELLLWFGGVFLMEKTLPLSRVLPMDSIMYSFKGIVLLLLVAYLMRLLKWGWLHGMLSWFGKHSLELYLTNIFLIQGMYYFNLDFWCGKKEGYLTYGAIVALGIGASALFSLVEKKLIMKKENVHAE